MQKGGSRRKGPVDENTKKNQSYLQRRRNQKQQRQHVKSKEVKVEDVVAKYDELAKANLGNFTSFRDFPLSERTLKGLEEANFVEPTEIQRDSLPYSLTGSDVVAAAKTGSGKTLALVIPLLECLWRQRWSRKTDGFGALIISPTRELALQTFNTINKVGKYHDFSCALLMGGTDVNYEKRRLHSMNIVVCTPGRLQQHLDENELFQCESMQILVIDEADRILDMGFSKQINAIVECLPPDRQTLLFSATQTNDIEQLSRVCTKDPVFVSVHERAVHATPESLKQSYLICKEEEKMNMLWSFITHHKHSKMLVFVSSCRQARFITESFCHLRPGTSLMGLWGTMKQNKRLDVFESFEKRKSACLIATDIASRGLDFSSVDWVVQMDAPATVDDYIHRVGRTARMNKKGAAIMFLTENQEQKMEELLKARKIPVSRLRHDPSSIVDIRLKLQTVLAQFPQLNEMGQKAVLAYLRSVYLMSNKSIFDVDSIDAKALAESLGLVAIKRIRFLQKKREGKKLIMKQTTLFDGHDFGAKNVEDEEEEEEKEEEDEDDSLFTVKRKDVFNVRPELMKKEQNVEKEKKKLEEGIGRKKAKVVTRLKEAKTIIKKGVSVNRKVIFDEEGEVEKGMEEEWKTKGLDLQKAINEMPVVDKVDLKEWRLKRKLIRKEKKEKEKNRRRKSRAEDEMEIGGSDDEDEEGSVDDLSWLPDPDNPKKYSDDDEEEGDGGPDEEEEVPPPVKRRKGRSREDAEKEVLALLGA